MPDRIIQVDIPEKEAYRLRYLFPRIAYRRTGYPVEVAYSVNGDVDECELLIEQGKYGVRLSEPSGVVALVEQSGVLSGTKLDRLKTIESSRCELIDLFRTVAALRDSNQVTVEEYSGEGLLSIMEMSHRERIPRLLSVKSPDGFTKKVLEYLNSARSRIDLAKLHPRTRDRVLSMVSRMDRRAFNEYQYDSDYPVESLIDLSFCLRGL